MINIGIGIGWAKAIYSVANNVIANFKARVLSYPTSIFEAGPCLDATLEGLNAKGLLDNASLVITPNAYNEGILYDIVPNTTLGDMDVVRATTATRVNSAGLIEVVPRNLLTYSEQFNDASWVNNGATIIPNDTIAPDGNLTADRLTAIYGGFGVVKFSTWTATNKVASCFVKVNTSNLFRIANVSGGGGNATFNLSTQVITTTGGFTGSIEALPNGWFRCVAINTLGTIGTFSLGVTAIGESVFIWGAQLETGSTATEYFPTTTRLNIPRIDYTNGSCPSLLVEPQRTNLALYSEQFDTFWAKTNATITPNIILSPSGLINADKMTADATLAQIQYAITGTISTPYTVSFWIKRITGSGQVYIRSVENLNTPITITNEWVRYSLTTTNTSISVRIGIALQTIGDEIAIWGAQLEIGSYPTSYIPTVASIQTRNADVISKTGISSLIGQTEGTLFSSFYYNGNAKVGSGIQLYPFYIGQGTSANSITIGIYEDKLLCRVFASGTPQNNFVSSTLSIGVHKVAFVYATNNLKLFLDGSLIATDTSATIPTCSQVYIGASGTTVSAQAINVNNNILYKTALTDTECITLTTL